MIADLPRTLQVLHRGLDAETASAAASNPEILKAVLPGLFGGGERSIGEDYDPETGQPRKFFYNQKGAPNVQYLGGNKRDASQNAISGAIGKANLKRVESYKSQADQAREMMGSLNQLKELRAQVPDTLKGLPGGMGGTIAGWTDYFGVTNGAKALSPQELEIQLGFTAKTKGAITDREMSLFAGGVPGFGMTDEAAGKVISGMEATAQRKIEQAKFFEAWFAANKGSLEGAQDSWDAYINANPVIVRNPDGTLAVNSKNVGNWKDYIGGSDEDRRTNFGPTPGTSAIEGSETSGPDRRMDRPTVTTPEDYDALDSGTLYLDKDGNERRKR